MRVYSSTGEVSNSSTITQSQYTPELAVPVPLLPPGRSVLSPRLTMRPLARLARVFVCYKVTGLSPLLAAPFAPRVTARLRVFITTRRARLDLPTSPRRRATGTGTRGSLPLVLIRLSVFVFNRHGDYVSVLRKPLISVSWCSLEAYCERSTPVAAGRWVGPPGAGWGHQALPSAVGLPGAAERSGTTRRCRALGGATSHCWVPPPGAAGHWLGHQVLLGAVGLPGAGWGHQALRSTRWGHQPLRDAGLGQQSLLGAGWGHQ